MKIKKIISYIIFLIPSIIILLLLLYFSNLKKVYGSLLTIPWYAYIFVFIICAFSWFLRGLRWKSFLKMNRVKIKVITSTNLCAFGNYVNWIVPARIGDLAWAYASKKILKTKFSIALITIMINRFLDFFSLVIILQLIFVFFAKELFIKWAYTINLISLTILSLFFIGLFIFSKEKLMLFFLKGPLKKLKKYYLILKKSLLDSTNKKLSFMIWTFVSIIIWFIEALVTYILFISAGVYIKFFVILLAVVIGNMTKTLGITPGGTGTYEAGVALTIMTLTNVDYSVALTFAIVDHIIKKIFVLTLGTISLNYYGLKIFQFNRSSKKIPSIN
jgi:glycosyltransferase AglD